MGIFRKCFVFFLIFISLNIFVEAADFSVEFSTILGKITKDSAGVYNITIINEGSLYEDFRIFSLNYPDWDIYTDPIQNPILVNVGPQKKETITIILDPINKDLVGSYIVPINIQAISTNEKASVKLPITVSMPKEGPGEYVPTVLANINVPKEIDPREKFSIKIKLSNQNILDIENLIISIGSPHLMDTIKTTLGPKEEKTLERTLEYNPKTQPQKDILTIDIMRGNQSIVKPITRIIEILPYTDIQREISPENKFLQVSKSISFKNNGNARYKGVAKIETSFFRAIFTKTFPKATLAKDGNQRYFVWDIELDPDESVNFEVDENYYMLFILIILSIIIVLGYYTTRTPLLMLKSGSDVQTREGGISELKVMLHLKNRGTKTITGIEIKDRIPHFINIDKEVSIGTLHPTNVLKHEHKGTIVIWTIEKLDPNEERVINYKIKSNLSIIGSFILPHAVAKFKVDGKSRKSSSNRYTVTA